MPLTFNLNDFLEGNIFALLLIFTRLGTALMFLPGFGETSIPVRGRLLIALAISFLMLPLLGSHMPPMPTQAAALAGLIATEATVGFFLGVIVRLAISALDFAGQIIALQLGIGSAAAFNPAMATQGTIPGTLMGLLAIALVFTTNLHHLLLHGIVNSYEFLPPGPADTLPAANLSQTYVVSVSQSFSLAIMIAAPFIILGTVFNVGLALLARLQPAVQIFFVAMPLQIYFGIAIFLSLIGVIMSLWLEHAADIYEQLGLINP